MILLLEIKKTARERFFAAVPSLFIEIDALLAVT